MITSTLCTSTILGLKVIRARERAQYFRNSPFVAPSIVRLSAGRLGGPRGNDVITFYTGHVIYYSDFQLVTTSILYF